MKNIVIIVAGGTGSRMNAQVPKQYMLLQEKPVLMHTMEKFYLSASKPEIVLAIHPEMLSYWQKLCSQHHFTIPHHICFGGATRFQSVKSALTYIHELGSPVDCIAVHDGARPLIATETIDQAYAEALVKKAVIVATKSTNSVRLSYVGDASKAVDRDLVWIVQTPQVFSSDLLWLAYQQKEMDYFTDDASVVEQLGNNIHVLEGSYKNIKITFPEDLAIAELYMRST